MMRAAVWLAIGFAMLLHVTDSLAGDCVYPPDPVCRSNDAIPCIAKWDKRWRAWLAYLECEESRR